MGLRLCFHVRFCLRAGHARGASGARFAAHGARAGVERARRLLPGPRRSFAAARAPADVPGRTSEGMVLASLAVAELGAVVTGGATNGFSTSAAGVPAIALG